MGVFCFPEKHHHQKSTDHPHEVITTRMNHPPLLEMRELSRWTAIFVALGSQAKKLSVALTTPSYHVDFPMVDTCWYPNVLQNPPFLHIFLPFPDLKFSNPMKISGLDIPWHPDGSRDENCPQPALVAPGPSLLSFQFVQLGSLRCLGRGFPHFPHTEICGDHAEMWGISWWYNGRVGRIICLAQEKHGASAALSYFSFERIAACTWRAAMGPSRLKSNGEKFWPLFW